MLQLADARHFRRTLVGWSMLLAPIAALAALLVMPQPPGDSAQEILATVSADTGRWELGAWLLMLTAFLIVAPAVGSIHLMTEDDVAVGHVGGGLAIAGAFALCAIAGIDLALAEAAGAPARSPALVEGMAQLASVLSWVSLVTVGAATVLLTAGLHRVGVMPLAGVVAAVAGGLLFVVATAKPLEAAGIVILGAGVSTAGRAVLTMSDADWWAVLEHPGS